MTKQHFPNMPQRRPKTRGRSVRGPVSEAEIERNRRKLQQQIEAVAMGLIEPVVLDRAGNPKTDH